MSAIMDATEWTIREHGVSPTHARILRILARRGGEPIIADAIGQEIYADDPDGGPLCAGNAIRQHLFQLKRCIQGAPVSIVSCRGPVGYWLEMRDEWTPPQEAASLAERVAALEAQFASMTMTFGVAVDPTEPAALADPRDR